jgi:uncharacterized membrane protein HdeD (DUF308 family)
MIHIYSFVQVHAIRIFGVMNILGDVFIFSSGSAYESIFRQVAALLGILASLIFLFYGDGKLLPAPQQFKEWALRVKRPLTYTLDAGMGLIMVSGLCYIVSGIMQYHEEGRPQECLLGAFLVLATYFMIRRHPVVGSNFFICTTLTSLTMPLMFHDFLTTDTFKDVDILNSIHLDGYMVGAALCFITGNFIIRYTKHN